MESDEEREKQTKKAKRGKRSENVSGDEGAGGEPKQKKRRGKLKKSAEEGGEPAEGEDAALFSGDDEEQKPRKVSGQRRVSSLSGANFWGRCSVRRSELSGTMMTRKKRPPSPGKSSSK